MPHKLRLGVLCSGGGTNLQAILDNIAAGRLDAEVAVVIADVACGALDRARRAGAPAVQLDRHDKTLYPTREAFDAALLATLRSYQVSLVCHAGYLRIMTPELVRAYEDRMINLHPSLLPAFGGKGMWGHHVHEAVLAYGCKVSGCTVHFVTPEIDAGPIILQRSVPVAEEDTPETLAARILLQEHASYSEAIQLFAEGRLHKEGRRVRILEGKVESGE